MQELRLLLISLATVLLSSILLFIYFRSRIEQVEEKLEIMFNLIQSHAPEKHMAEESFMPNQMMEEQFMPNQMMNEQYNEENKQRINLIDVSEDEGSETDESDTDSDSDTETNDLVIDNESLLEDNIKKIALIDNTDVLFDQNICEENINHLENVNKNIIVQKDKNYEDANHYEDVTHNEDANHYEDVTHHEDVTHNEDVKENNEEEENIVQELSTDLSKLKVVELRKMCSEKGKSGYKSLRKSELIELLEN